LPSQRRRSPADRAMLSPARILIADDHAVVREGLKALFERQADLQVTAEAVDGMDAVDKATAADIDLVILDVAMPRLTGLQAVREISRRRSKLPVLLLSMYDREQYFFEAVAAGAAGYVLKRQADRDLIDACRAALRGEPFIYPAALGAIMRRYLDRVARGERPGQGPLTPRETEIVKLIAEGHSSEDIADLLTISPKTVERHRANILDKLGMRDRVEVTRYAIRAGLIEP
jgi:DNA-binding NarL/FixJ family response regulator